MKLNKIALAVVAAAVAPVAAQAGITVTPLAGYHYQEGAKDEQREVLNVGKTLEAGAGAKAQGVTLDNGLHAGAALGVELTPSTQFQVEYGVSNVDAYATKKAADRFDAEQQQISGNLLVGLNTESNFKPYVLVGAGQSKIKVENKEQFTNDKQTVVKAGTEVAESKDTIGNIGLGARYLVNDALALRGEVRGIHNFDNKWWEGLALAGLEVTLGGRLAPVVPVVPVAEPEPVVEVVEPVVEVKPAPVAPVVVEEKVVDTDGDGVADHLDACPATPRNLVVDARGCPRQVDLREDLRLELRVFFDYDKSAIKPQFREEIAKVADKMREFPNATAAIEGHASQDSSRSNARYNQRLSEARANAVKAMLTNEFGIAPNRLSAVGYGFDRPIAPNTTDEGKAMNRRVYAVISGNKVTTVNQTKDMVVR